MKKFLKSMTPLTWVTTCIGLVVGWFSVAWFGLPLGLLVAAFAGLVIGLANLGIHEIWWKWR